MNQLKWWIIKPNLNVLFDYSIQVLVFNFVVKLSFDSSKKIEG